ncbi:type-F conjugative transfer system protein TrbI [Burkholderia gladioli]|uniref:type-F conjugative transfer system protein TrbI n=1 Tax=Burkholderia gladioli TaxID=28095 RepID=UPI001C5DFA7B|nr:type-F conjugative transfer system protein TrbI [Burkholderia gladioli]MBW5284158.1 hypothetical protein [Burkholderia gladioli]
MTEPTQNQNEFTDKGRPDPMPDPTARDILKKPEAPIMPEATAMVSPACEKGSPRSTDTSAIVQIGLVLALALGAFGVYRTYTAPAQQSIYTVNLGALMTAKEIQQQSTTDPNVYGAAIQDFVKTLKGELDMLSKRGVIVIKSDSVLTDVPSIDLTGRLAKHFSLETELSEVPAHDAEARNRYKAQLRAQLGIGAASGVAAMPATPASGASSAAGEANPASGSDGLAHLD